MQSEPGVAETSKRLWASEMYLVARNLETEWALRRAREEAEETRALLAKLRALLAEIEQMRRE
jgi:hypothetical protein